MAECVLKIYSTNITGDRNALVEHIQTYLGTLDPVYTDEHFQYQRMDLDKQIKIDSAQVNSNANINQWNYVDFYQDNRHWYYFIESAEQKARSTIELTLTADSLNTMILGTDYNFDARTHITRQHKNRYLTTDRLTTGQINTLHAVVDDVPEVLPEMEKQKLSNTAITQGSGYANQKWYLMYTTFVDDNASADPLVVNLLPSNSTTPYTSTAPTSSTWTASSITGGVYYYFVEEDNPTLHDAFGGSFALTKPRLGTTLYKIALTLTDGEYVLGAQTALTSITFTTAFNYHRFKASNRNRTEVEVLNSPTLKIIVNFSSLYGLPSVDRSSSTLTKLIELPYLPDTITWVGDDIDLSNSKFKLTGNMLELKEYNDEFENSIKTLFLSELNITADSSNDYTHINRDATYETKLLNSEFYEYKLNYSDTDVIIDLERLTRLGNNTPSIDITYKPTNSMTSECLFKLTVDPTDATYREIQDFELYLHSTKDNEMPLFTSTWLNYLRYGYEQDRRLKNISIARSVGNAIVQTSGAMAAYGTQDTTNTKGTSQWSNIHFAMNAANAIISAFATAAEERTNLETKMLNAKNQKVSVSTTNAPDLFSYYSDNKLRLIKYGLIDRCTDIVAKLFHYGGYKCDKQGVPDTSSRYWFNYVQCEPVFYGANNAYDNWLEDLKVRWQAGATVMHYHYGWNWNQNYENWETFLLS